MLLKSLSYFLIFSISCIAKASDYTNSKANAASEANAALDEIIAYSQKELLKVNLQQIYLNLSEEKIRDELPTFFSKNTAITNPIFMFNRKEGIGDALSTVFFNNTATTHLAREYVKKMGNNDDKTRLTHPLPANFSSAIPPINSTSFITRMKEVFGDIENYTNLCMYIGNQIYEPGRKTDLFDPFAKGVPTVKEAPKDFFTKDLCCLVMENDLSLVDYWLEKNGGENLNLQKGEFGETALRYAILNNNPFIIRRLVEAGIDYDAKELGFTPLEFAILNNKVLSAVALIFLGADVNKISPGFFEEKTDKKTRKKTIVLKDCPILTMFIKDKRAAVAVEKKN